MVTFCRLRDLELLPPGTDNGALHRLALQASNYSALLESGCVFLPQQECVLSSVTKQDVAVPGLEEAAEGAVKGSLEVGVALLVFRDPGSAISSRLSC